MEQNIQPAFEQTDFNKVWFLFQETDKKMQETDRQMQETVERMKETDSRMKETDRQIQEMKVVLEASKLEVDEQMKETDRQMKNLLKKMSEAENRWGKFVETLVDGALIRIFKEKGIEITRTVMREVGYHNNEQYEIDIIGKNGDDLIVVEVKTTLTEKHVKQFVKKLKLFKEVFADYSEKRVIGAVGFINHTGGATIFAEKQGLFVIKATGESARISNADGFKPKYW